MKKKTLIGTLGGGVGAVLTAIILYGTVPTHEGLVNYGYLDPVGIPTKCFGDTTNVEVGKFYTTEECYESLENQLNIHAAGVLECTPELEGHTYQLAAATSFAYNVGVGAYCKSTMAKKFKSGDFRGACEQLDRWVYSGGRVLKGLVRRRAMEKAICIANLED